MPSSGIDAYMVDFAQQLIRDQTYFIRRQKKFYMASPIIAERDTVNGVC